VFGPAVRWTYVFRCVALAIAAAPSSCTTFMQPEDCAGETHKCGEHHDVTFCENVAVAVAGNDCAKAGIVPSKPFCFVSTGPCVSTNYALKDQDCRVVQYEPVRYTYECAPGTPTFGP
jgi:hypothetical protein